ncbi:MAG TPA: TonB-dependent receptor [Candidatus Angelobacter sp.]|nr:TonB-dependent receptor [Candidatus Angelobacter sp.]
MPANRRFSRLVPVLTLFIVVLLSCGVAYPQGNTGRILGVVTDQSGGYVANATVTITDVARGVSQTLSTDSDGAYVAINLLPSTYSVRVEYKGFKTFDRKNILLEVGKDVRVDAVLQTGSASETVTITEDVPMVDTTSTTLGGTISNEIINDLPLNGRNYQNLISLRPGTAVYPGGGPWTQTTNGIRPEDTSYIVDGVTNDESFMGLSVTNAAAVLGDAATLIPIDAIQEFNTQVNPKAEFGWKPGAITSVGLKSGTNDIHGTAYGFGRGDMFDARNYFNPVGTPKQSLELEQYGGSAGGHIIRDKLFYFGAYEGQMYTVANALPGHIPTTAAVAATSGVPADNGCMVLTFQDCTFSLPNALADLQAADATIRPLSLYILGCSQTAPFTPCTGGFYGSNNSQGKFVSLNFPNVNSSKNALGKVDYHINDHNALSGSYFFGNDTIVGMDFFELLAQFRTKVHSRAQAASAHWAWTPSSSWANELRGGFTHYTLQIVPNDSSTKYNLNMGLTNPLLNGIPNVNMPGIFTELGAFHNFPKIVGPDKVYDFIDQVSYLRGKHAFKFGGELRRDLVHQATFRAGRGRVYFNSLEDFLQGNVAKVTFLAGDPTRNMSQWLYAGYAQDDWRIVPKVTLNLGLRYEFQAVPTEAQNLLGNWEPSVGFEQVGKNISSIYNPDHKNFSPRFGIAWDVTGKGTTVVRAGGSLVYSLLTMSTFMSQQNTQNTVTLGVGTVPTGATIVVCPVALVNKACPVAPTSTPGIGTITATGITLHPPNVTWVDQTTAIYPSNVTGLLQCGDGVNLAAGGKDPGQCNTFAMNRNFRTPYVENWTLGIQHAFSGKLSLDATYVGNHGVKLPGVVDLNQADPTTGAQPFANKYPYLNFINYLSNTYGSTYHGLQTTLTARNYHGLDFVAGYTYSHALDGMSSNWVAFLPMDSTRPFLEHGSSDEDIRHRFTFSITYSLPEIKTKSQLLEGWQVNTIITMQSGQPWNVNDQTNGFSGAGDNADRWDLFGNPADFKSSGQNSIPLCVNGASGGCTYVNSPSGNTIALSDQLTAADWAKCRALAPSGTPLGNALDTAIGGGTGGCYVSFNNKSFLLPNAMGAFGTMGRNIFRDTGFRNVDLSVSKNFKFGERMKAQFRIETFNIFNHPNYANPNGATSGYGQNAFADPSVVGSFGCGCSTPDQAAFNPVLGSGSNRAIQLGLKFIF